MSCSFSLSTVPASGRDIGPWIRTQFRRFLSRSSLLTASAPGCRLSRSRLRRTRTPTGQSFPRRGANVSAPVSWLPASQPCKARPAVKAPLRIAVLPHHGFANRSRPPERPGKKPAARYSRRMMPGPGRRVALGGISACRPHCHRRGSPVRQHTGVVLRQQPRRSGTAETAPQRQRPEKFPQRQSLLENPAGQSRSGNPPQVQSRGGNVPTVRRTRPRKRPYRIMKITDTASRVGPK